EPRIHGELDADRAEQLLHTVEMGARFVVQITADHRSTGDELAHCRVLAVQDAHRIALEPPHAVLVERSAVRREVLDQRLLVTGARLRRAERVDLEPYAREAE